MAEAVDRAYQVIRDGILSGLYPQGSHLSAQVLAEASGFSRTPVREAMRRLHAEGLIRIIPNRGAFVATWSEGDVEHYFELDLVLESFSAELAASRVTPKDLAMLRQLVDEMDRLVFEEPPPLARVKEVNDRFHKEVMAISGNVRLEHYLQSMIEAELVFGTVGEYTREELQRTAMQHAELVDALEARDPIWAKSAMATHLLTARNAMMRSVRRPRRPGEADSGPAI